MKVATIKIGQREIGTGHPVFIVAEIGKNFIQKKEECSVKEYLKNAKALVDAAVEVGADAVKFQTHETEDEVLKLNFASPHFKEQDRYHWVLRNTSATPVKEFWIPLKKYCDKKGIIFFSTPMSRGAAYKLEKIGPPVWKVGSGDAQDYVLLDFLIKTGKPIIISNGMVSLSELDEVIKFVTSKKSSVAILYCISQYPAPAEYFNLATIKYLQKKYPQAVIGFSDHSLGSEIALAAVKLGAVIIEKHFSLSRNLWGSDHKVSMIPAEFREMVRAIRKGEYAKVNHLPYYGVKEKELEGASNQFRPYFHKALMVGADIKKGSVILPELVYAMRPIMLAGGLPANQFYDVIGKKVKKDLKKYDPITLDVFE